MARNDTTSAVVDNILRISVTTGLLAAGMVLPNLLIALDKPINHYMKSLDKRARERELRRIISYMKTSSLLSGDYEHGLVITNKGRRRLSDADFDRLRIEPKSVWDKKWRLVFYDIPEKYKSGRDAIAVKLRELGFYQLQRSVWVLPLPCRDIVEKVAVHYKVDKYVSLIEANKIDNQKRLIEKFKKTFPQTKFHS